MALLLVKVNAIKVMLLGRLRSFAFTNYVREEALEMFSVISFQMANQSDFFTATPTISCTDMDNLRSHVNRPSVPANVATAVTSPHGPHVTPEAKTYPLFNVRS